jgi:hypothetical protein
LLINEYAITVDRRCFAFASLISFRGADEDIYDSYLKPSHVCVGFFHLIKVSCYRRCKHVRT